MQPQKGYVNRWTNTTQKDRQELCAGTNDKHNNDNDNSGSNHSADNKVKLNKDNLLKNSAQTQNKNGTTIRTQGRIAGT